MVPHCAFGCSCLPAVVAFCLPASLSLRRTCSAHLCRSFSRLRAAIHVLLAPIYSLDSKGSCMVPHCAFGCLPSSPLPPGWGVCNLLLPPDMYDPSMLLQKTELISGFDCRALVTSNDVNGASVCSEGSELRRCVVLLPQSCCRVMPIAANIGLALSAAAHNGAFSEVISALESLAGGKSMVAVPRVCSSSPTWFPSHAVAATLLSVMEGIEEAGCSVVLQDRNGCVMQLTCSLSTELQAAELVPLVGSSVVCVLTLKISTECVQVEGIYRC